MDSSAIYNYLHMVHTIQSRRFLKSAQICQVSMGDRVFIFLDIDMPCHQDVL
jgi:hypothetical protein